MRVLLYLNFLLNIVKSRLIIADCIKTSFYFVRIACICLVTLIYEFYEEGSSFSDITSSASRYCVLEIGRIKSMCFTRWKERELSIQ